MRSHVEFVVKISKHCNLRCNYCYEYNELANTRRMSLENMERMFRNARAYTAGDHCDYTLFIWHGGEPLLIKPSYYEQIGERQRDILGDDVYYMNVTQTNLTVLTDELLDFLKEERFFVGCGVSVDPFGAERVDVKGRLSNERVFANMQRMLDREIPFSAITVLTQATVPYLNETFSFFDALGLEFRALPYYKSASESQIDRHALSYTEIVTALKALFDLWLVSENAVRISPLHEYILMAMRHVRDEKKGTKNLWDDEVVFAVDLDGNVWGESCDYDPDKIYGNIFEQELETLLASDTRRRVCDESAARMEAHCRQCPYFGACPGDYVMNASAEQRHVLQTDGCPVREMVSHVLTRFEETGLTESVLARPGIGEEADPVTQAMARA